MAKSMLISFAIGLANGVLSQIITNDIGIKLLSLGSGVAADNILFKKDSINYYDRIVHIPGFLTGMTIVSLCKKKFNNDSQTNNSNVATNPSNTFTVRIYQTISDHKCELLFILTISVVIGVSYVGYSKHNIMQKEMLDMKQQLLKYDTMIQPYINDINNFKKSCTDELNTVVDNLGDKLSEINNDEQYGMYQILRGFIMKHCSKIFV